MAFLIASMLLQEFYQQIAFLCYQTSEKFEFPVDSADNIEQMLVKNGEEISIHVFVLSASSSSFLSDMLIKIPFSKIIIFNAFLLANCSMRQVLLWLKANQQEKK